MAEVKKLISWHVVQCGGLSHGFSYIFSHHELHQFQRMTMKEMESSHQVDISMIAI